MHGIIFYCGNVENILHKFLYTSQQLWIEILFLSFVRCTQTICLKDKIIIPNICNNEKKHYLYIYKFIVTKMKNEWNRLYHSSKYTIKVHKKVWNSAKYSHIEIFTKCHFQ